jgi:hypothetical protein
MHVLLTEGKDRDILKMEWFHYLETEYRHWGGIGFCAKFKLLHLLHSHL